MSDEQPSPELELARPARPEPESAPVATSPARGVRSAARANAQAEEARPAFTRERLKEGAVDTLLNSVSILGEVLEDFRSSDRFFKFKALVLTAWLALCLTALGVALPQPGPANDINARLIVGGDGTSYMVTNESSEPWLDVEITVNGAWRATETRLEANGGSVTLSPAVLFDAQGRRAPSTLSITELEVRVQDPEGTVVLLRNGKPQ